MKILLGGVPFGCNNIGDEAILACVIAIFRRVKPEAELIVATGDRPGTEKKFQVATVPLYGFDRTLPVDGFKQALNGVDVYVWAGATGLSDYPLMGCDLLEIAQAGGVKTIIWNVGMNDALNPAFFKMRGKKLQLCQIFKKFTGIDLQRMREDRKIQSARERLAGTLSKCELVVLRDQRSLNELRKCAPFPNAIHGADSAILQPGTDMLPWSPEESKCFQQASKHLAICISDQNPIQEFDEFCSWLDRLLASHPELQTVMIPMNPITDFGLMKRIHEQLENRSQALLLRLPEPEQVQELVGKCDLVISSRLHLMILALNRCVPGIGIARGSKIPFFLDEFGLPCAGTTDQIDFEALSKHTDYYLKANNFREAALRRREKMLIDLEAAIKRLENALYTQLG